VGHSGEVPGYNRRLLLPGVEAHEHRPDKQVPEQDRGLADVINGALVKVMVPDAGVFQP